MIQLPEEYKGTDLNRWLVQNKALLFAQKRAMFKQADSTVAQYILSVDNEVVKASNTAALKDATKIEVTSIINTTKLFDSHMDVHIDGIWTKSVKENKQMYLIQEHDFTFKGIITDNVDMSVKTVPWTEIGYSYEGKTEALTFKSVIDKNESPFMFKRYADGKVKEHSVGMKYVKYDMAINDKAYKEEYEVWQKYFDMIVNKSDAEARGFFFPVFEGKVLEGSAVVKGSNFATPTISITQVKGEPDKSTPEPTRVTLTADELMKHYKL